MSGKKASGNDEPTGNRIPSINRRRALKITAVGATGLAGFTSNVTAGSGSNEKQWQALRKQLKEIHGDAEAKIVVKLAKKYWEKVEDGTLSQTLWMEPLSDEIIAHDETPSVTAGILRYREDRTELRDTIGISDHPALLPVPPDTETTELPSTQDSNPCTKYPVVYLDRIYHEEIRTHDFFGTNLDTYSEADPEQAHIEHFIAAKGFGQGTMQTRMWGYVVPEYSTTYEIGTWVRRCGAVYAGGTTTGGMWIQNMDDGTPIKDFPPWDNFVGPNNPSACSYKNYANQHSLVEGTLYRVGLFIHSEAAANPLSDNYVSVVDFAEKNNDNEGFDIYKDQFRTTPLGGVCTDV